MQKNSDENFILKIIKYTPSVFLILISILITIYLSYQNRQDLKIEKEKIKTEYIKSNKDRINLNIQTVHKYLNKQILNANYKLKEDLKSKIDNVYNMATNIYNKNKDSLSKEEIIANIKNVVEVLRFNNGKGYFNINTKEELKHKLKELQKIGITRIFEPYNLTISTGVDINDFEKQLKKVFLDYIKVLEYKDKEYIFVIDYKGNLLLTKTKFSNISEIDKQNPFPDLFNKFVNSKKEDAYLEYGYPIKEENYSKISYLKKLNNYNWVLGSGFDSNKLNKKVNDKQKELENEYANNIYYTLIITLIMTIILLLISTSISKLLEKRFLTYKENLEKQIKDNLNQKETLLRAQEVAHIGDWELDLKTNKAYWSNEIIRIFGLDRKDEDNFGPELLKSIILEEDRDCFEDSIHLCIETGKEHKCIYRIKRPDNEIKWIDCRGILDKNKSSILGTIQDITESKLLEIEKHQKDELLYQQSKMAAMGEMLGNIAHQWRQPLSTISTAATGTKVQKEMDCLSDEQLYSSLTAINNSAQYLSQTIDDFRGFFNPNNNYKEKFNISNTLIKTLKLVNAQFTAKDIEIIENIEPYELVSIENEIIQVLINILNNAKDVLISKENQRRLIFINTYKKNDSYYIEILDNAGGIKKDIIDRIFEPYFTTKHKAQGTGIGLYMSQDIINNHLHGVLSVENEEYTYEDKKYLGARFIIKI